MDETKARYAQNTQHVPWQMPWWAPDIFRLSHAGVVEEEMIKTMAAKPMVFAASANPMEIMPELVKEVCPMRLLPQAALTM